MLTIFDELSVASRTDADLREVMGPACKEIDQPWWKVTEHLFPDLSLSEERLTANLLTVYLLEGTAMHGDVHGAIPGKIVPGLKNQLFDMFCDVRELDRATAMRASDRYRS